MATPVQTDQWAGSLECKFCGRTRLMAEAFSKSMMVRGGPLKCKDCVQKQEAETRANARVVESEERRICASCQTTLAATSFNKTQWNKGEGLSRCKACVDVAVVQEAAKVEMARADKMNAARQAVEEAKKAGNSLAILKAESVLAALEGEKVTGLRPVKMNHRARGGGRSRTVIGRTGRGSR